MDINNGNWEVLNKTAPILNEESSSFLYHDKVCFLSENNFIVFDLNSMSYKKQKVVK